MQDASNILAFMKRVYLIFINWHLLFEDFHFQEFEHLLFYAEQNPRIIKYKDYKNFTFGIDPLRELSLSNPQNRDFDKFNIIVNTLLESNSSMKEIYIRRNQAPFYEQELFNNFRK